jgi:Sigma-70, region 4
MSGRLTSAGRRLPALLALTLAATMTATTAAFGLAVPTVSAPKVGAPAQPQLPSLPSLPAPHAPALPTPASPVPVPALPSPGGHAAPAPGATPARPGGAPHSVADAVAANGVALAPRSRSATGAATGGGRTATSTSTPQRRAAAGRAARERRFRRTVRRLSGCIDALPGLERRVLVLRAGLEGQRPHTRGSTAKRLGISRRRTAAAERGGLRRLRRAERSSGCAAPAGPGPATPNRALAAAPILAGLLGPAPAPGAPPAAARDDSDVSPASASSPPQAAGAGAPARPAAAGSEPARLPPLLIALALVAAALALAVRPGWRVAHGALMERAERSTDRRQAELAATVRSILGEHNR